mmetsp:Transcript_153431/g.282394  ORF Transcript_153431/g.282394 Transcript_153431/m.282394 type:complete len:241 (+) Transcript_153431:1180-1902(+)
MPNRASSLRGNILLGARERCRPTHRQALTAVVQVWQRHGHRWAAANHRRECLSRWAKASQGCTHQPKAASRAPEEACSPTCTAANLAFQPPPMAGSRAFLACMVYRPGARASSEHLLMVQVHHAGKEENLLLEKVKCQPASVVPVLAVTPGWEVLWVKGDSRLRWDLARVPWALIAACRRGASPACHLGQSTCLQVMDLVFRVVKEGLVSVPVEHLDRKAAHSTLQEEEVLWGPKAAVEE